MLQAAIFARNLQQIKDVLHDTPFMSSFVEGNFHVNGVFFHERVWY